VLFRSLAGRAFQYVVHAASANDFFVPGYPQLALNANALGTLNILQALDTASLQRFLYFSTFHVYGVAEGDVDETTPPAPRNDYALTHLFAEQYVQMWGRTQRLPYTIIRLSNSYGCPVDPESTKWYLVLNDLAKAAHTQREIVLKSNGLGRRDFIWMGDVAQAVAQLLPHPGASGTVLNLCGGTSYRMLDVAQAVQAAYAQRYGITLPISTNPDDKTPESRPLNVSSTALQMLLPDFQPRNAFEDEALAIFQLLDAAAVPG